MAQRPVSLLTSAYSGFMAHKATNTARREMCFCNIYGFPRGSLRFESTVSRHRVSDGGYCINVCAVQVWASVMVCSGRASGVSRCGLAVGSHRILSEHCRLTGSTSVGTLERRPRAYRFLCLYHNRRLLSLFLLNPGLAYVSHELYQQETRRA